MDEKSQYCGPWALNNSERRRFFNGNEDVITCTGHHALGGRGSCRLSASPLEEHLVIVRTFTSWDSVPRVDRGAAHSMSGSCGLEIRDLG